MIRFAAFQLLAAQSFVMIRYREGMKSLDASVVK
jgi:hypothetical protein